MVLDPKKFPKARKEVLSREEVKAIIKGKGVTRPVQCVTPLLLLPSEQPFREKELNELWEQYPDDAVFFEYTRPGNFGKPNDRYVWVDVENADPLEHGLNESKIGIDEKTAVDWDIIEQISEGIPDPFFPESLVQDFHEDDGRYRGLFWTRLSFERLWHFRGMSNTLMDFYLYPEKVKALLKHLRTIYFKAIERAANEYHFDAIAFTDDIGMQDRPFFSEDIFIEFIKPHYKEVFDYAHQHGLDVWLHTCGNVEPFIDHFVELGLDVLHPVQKYTMDEQKIAQKYRGKLCFWVGMDVQRILPFGTTEDVRHEVKYLIDTFHIPNEGRLVMGPGNRFRHDIPTENIEAFFDELYHYGKEVESNKAVGNHRSPAEDQQVFSRLKDDQDK
jgi:uroporphyrinogen decarboxylase